MAAACILTFSGYAAAQSTTAKATTSTSKTQKTGVEATNKKAPAKKTETEPIKLAVPKLNDNDPAAIPKQKD